VKKKEESKARNRVGGFAIPFAYAQKSVDNQQQLPAGRSFKSIPIQPANLGFVQEMK